MHRVSVWILRWMIFSHNIYKFIEKLQTYNERLKWEEKIDWRIWTEFRYIRLVFKRFRQQIFHSIVSVGFLNHLDLSFEMVAFTNIRTMNICTVFNGKVFSYLYQCILCSVCRCLLGFKYINFIRAKLLANWWYILHMQKRL